MKKIWYFILSSALMFGFATPAFAGLGISPSDWIEANGLVGQRMEKTFVISRSNPDQDLYFTSEITGDIVPWITIENGNSFVMKKGDQELPVKVFISIPKNAQYKEYKSEIRLKSDTRQANGNGAPIGVLLSALIRIDLTVSDKPFLKYDVLQISIPKQESGKPLDVILKIWNQGNVEAKPTKVTFDFFDKFNQVQLDSKSVTDFSAASGVAPFSEGEFKFTLPVNLAPEQYWVKVNVDQDDRIIKTDDITFDIVEKLPFGASSSSVCINCIILKVLLVAVALISLLMLVLALSSIFKRNNVPL